MSLYGIQLTHDAARMLAQLPNLERLDLPGCDIDDESLALVTKAERLEELDIRRTNVTDDGLRHLRKCRFLKSLWISDPISDKGLLLLKQVPSIENLYLYCTGLSAANIGELSGVRTLAFKLPMRDPVELSNLVRVREIIVLMSTENPDEALYNAFSQMPALRSLTLSCTWNKLDNPLHGIGKVKQLESLHMPYSELEGKEWMPIVDLTNLKTFTIGSAHNLRDLTAIARLENLEELRLGRTGIGDEGFSALESMRKLRLLRLTSARVDRRFVGSIETLVSKDLRVLALVDTSISREDLIHLTRLVPELRLSGIEVLSDN